jgi:hypothetical protein
MSNRRLDKLEDSLSPKEAVIHWLSESHAYGSLPAYVESLIDQPDTAQPFIAVPAQVEKAVWESMRGQRPAFVKKVMRETTGDTVFLLRLVIGLNVHIEETLRVERLRHAALYWWSRSLGPERRTKGGPKDVGHPDWEHGVATLRGVLLGTDRARAAAEAKYLDGHDCLLPESAAAWRDLFEAAEVLAGGLRPDADSVVEADRRVWRVMLMARADGLEASGQHAAADDIALRVGRQMVMKSEGADG